MYEHRSDSDFSASSEDTLKSVKWCFKMRIGLWSGCVCAFWRLCLITGQNDPDSSTNSTAPCQGWTGSSNRDFAVELAPWIFHFTVKWVVCVLAPSVALNWLENVRCFCRIFQCSMEKDELWFYFGGVWGELKTTEKKTWFLSEAICVALLGWTWRIFVVL